MAETTTEYQVNTADASELARFFGVYSSAYSAIETPLLMLELDPGDESYLQELADAITSIQVALKNIGFLELAGLTQALIDLVISIKQERVQFQTLVSDIVLMGIDDVKFVIEKIIEGDERCVLLNRLQRIVKTINAIEEADMVYQDSVIKDALMLLDPSVEVIEPSISSADSLTRLFDDSPPDEEELAAYGVEENEDFIFFRALAEPLETRAHYWKGRSQRMLRLALKMNDQAGRPVDPNQLAAAVYIHDVGMALLPLDIINSRRELTEEELEQVREHPKIGFELLRYMKQWREAATIVFQHHERVDGSGYPYGLTEDEICEGAKIIAIVDAIDARTHERAHASVLKNPLLRAAMEIGKQADRHFSSYWVDIFKQVFQQMRKQGGGNGASN